MAWSPDLTVSHRLVWCWTWVQVLQHEEIPFQRSLMSLQTFLCTSCFYASCTTLKPVLQTPKGQQQWDQERFDKPFSRHLLYFQTKQKGNYPLFQERLWVLLVSHSSGIPCNINSFFHRSNLSKELSEVTTGPSELSIASNHTIKHKNTTIWSSPIGIA